MFSFSLSIQNRIFEQNFSFKIWKQIQTHALSPPEQHGQTFHWHGEDHPSLLNTPSFEFVLEKTAKQVAGNYARRFDFNPSLLITFSNQKCLYRKQASLQTPTRLRQITSICIELKRSFKACHLNRGGFKTKWLINQLCDSFEIKDARCLSASVNMAALCIDFWKLLLIVCLCRERQMCHPIARAIASWLPPKISRKADLSCNCSSNS